MRLARPSRRHGTRHIRRRRGMPLDSRRFRALVPRHKPIEGPTDMRTHRSVFLALVATLAIVSAARPAAADGLRFIEFQHDGTAGVEGLDRAQGVVVSPDGRHVYVASENDSALTVFSRGTNGALSLIEMHRDNEAGVDGLSGAHGIAISPDGAHLYVSSLIDDAIAIFARNATSGTLQYFGLVRDKVGGVNGLDRAEAVTVSPDGAHVYAVGFYNDSLAIFTRDPVTGALSYVSRLKNTVGGVTGLAGPRAVGVSPDGLNVYVAASTSDAVSVYSRNTTSGALTQVQVLQDEQGGLTTLDAAQGLAISPDGGQVYVAAANDDALTVFTRAAGTGLLVFAEAHIDDVGPVKALNGACDVAVSPDGTHVYVSGEIADSLGVFRRNVATGSLSYVERVRDGVGDIDGLDGTRHVAVSPDSQSVYATAVTDDAVAVFHVRRCGDGMLDTGEECDDGNGIDGDCCSNSCVAAAAATPCDDGAYCTVGDVCDAGICHGTARDCSALDDDCNDGVCNETADDCVAAPKADGTSCDDGNACTHADECTAGVCAGDDAVSCPANECQNPGACNPLTGLCGAPTPKANGAACDDGNACTETDTCLAGVCTGRDPVVCEADECHLAGTCNPATGECTHPNKPAGTLCDDGDPCTAHDTCVAGTCQGASLVDRDNDGVCDELDLCPEIADPAQLDVDADGIGDRCECTAPAPGHCIAGGGSKATDCLVEFVSAGPVTLNRTRTAVLGVLTCRDGDPACDLDGAADGRCTFGLAVCVGNHDPRLSGCEAGDVEAMEVMTPAADRGKTADRLNASALEDMLGTFGVAIHRHGAVIHSASESPSAGSCSPLVHLVMTAPAPGGKPLKRKFKIRAQASDGRVDTDKLTLTCTR